MLAAQKSWKWLERIICMGHHHPNSLQVWPTLLLLNCKRRVRRLRGNSSFFFSFFEGGIWLCLFFFHLFYVSFTTCILVCVYLLIYSFNCVCMDWLIFLERGMPLSPLNTSISLEGDVTPLSHTPNCEGQAKSSIQSRLSGRSLCRAGQRGVYSHRLPAPPLSVWLVKEWSTSAGEYDSEIMFYSETLL